MAAKTSQLAAGSVDQIVRHGPGRPVRNSAHGIGHVTVEAREETKAMFAGQIFAAVPARSGYGKASRFAAWNWKELVDLDVKLALDQLMGRAKPRDAAAEDEDLRIHGSLAPPRSSRRRATFSPSPIVQPAWQGRLLP